MVSSFSFVIVKHYIRQPFDSQSETLDDTKLSNFGFSGHDPTPFVGKILSSTLLWCCMCTQFVILENQF